MNTLYLFLMIFFGIIGVAKTVYLVYDFIVKKIYVLKRRDSDIKIWMK